MLKFATFISDIELPFYTSLASHKINHDKLNDSARSLVGLYEIRPSDLPDVSCRLQLHGNALISDKFVILRTCFLSPWSWSGISRVPAGYFRAEGIIKNVNTIEEYRNLDKRAILFQSAQTVHKGTRVVVMIKTRFLPNCYTRFGMRSATGRYSRVRPFWLRSRSSAMQISKGTNSLINLRSLYFTRIRTGFLSPMPWRIPRPEVMKLNLGTIIIDWMV